MDNKTTKTGITSKEYRDVANDLISAVKTVKQLAALAEVLEKRIAHRWPYIWPNIEDKLNEKSRSLAKETATGQTELLTTFELESEV